MSLFNGIKWPYATMQQLNLDWLLENIANHTLVPVDSGLSETSTNPVQNAVLTAIIGTETPTTTEQTLTGAVNELNSGLKKSILQAPVKAVTANGTSSNTLTGLTEDHVVGNWGLFQDAACKMPIASNRAPCDITISTEANAWTLTIANFSSAFYIRPSFILKQN